jgi:FKBP-type peptidyl-prolyl cis-trans isomerase SlyD
MRTVQQGDRVQVHFVKRSQLGEVVSSRGRAPLELEVGTENRRLPGLGLALVGLSEGQQVVVTVPAHLAYGPPGPERTRRVARSRFMQGQELTVGGRVRVTARNGRRRLVRVVEVHETSVVVATNHPWAGQDVILEVEILSIRAPAPGGVALPQAAADDLPS